MKRLLLGLLLLLASQMPVFAHQSPSWLPQVGYDQHLNAVLPLVTAFQDEAGKVQPIGHYFARQPVILVLGYYGCKNLCSVVMDGLLESLQRVGFKAGQQFSLVAVSIDPHETPALAAAKKTVYARQLKADDAGGWHFLTGSPASIQAVAHAVGFRYVYDRQGHQYAHAAGVVVLTPQGRIARYFYGVSFSPRDLRLALVEAAQDKIGSPADYLLLLCCRYDPHLGRYTFVIMNSMRVLGGLTLVLLASMFWRQYASGNRGGHQ